MVDDVVFQLSPVISKSVGRIIHKHESYGSAKILVKIGIKSFQCDLNYNLDHNILKLYDVLTTSKTKHDISEIRTY